MFPYRFRFIPKGIARKFPLSLLGIFMLLLLGVMHSSAIAASSSSSLGNNQHFDSQVASAPPLSAQVQPSPSVTSDSSQNDLTGNTALLFQNDRYAVRVYKEGEQAYVNVYNKETRTQPLNRVPISVTPAGDPEKDPTKYVATISDEEYIVTITQRGASNLTILKGGATIYNQGGQRVEIARKVPGISEQAQSVNPTRELIKTIFANAAKLTLFTLMLSFGLRWTFDDVVWLWKNPSLLVRSLVSVLVLVPVLGVLVTFIPGLTVAERIGIGVIAACPGAPMIPFKSLKAGGHANYVASLQFTICILAIISIPLTAAILAQFFPNRVALTPLTVAQQIFFAQVLPMGIGVALRQYWQKVANDLVEPVSKIANILLLLLAVALLIITLDKVINAGLPAYLAMTLMAIGSLVCGHVLGGTQPDTRTTLAYATTTRNAGLAFLLVTLNFPNLDFVKGGIVNTLVTYALIAAIVSIPYTAWRKRTLATQTNNFGETEVS